MATEPYVYKRGDTTPPLVFCLQEAVYDTNNNPVLDAAGNQTYRAMDLSQVASGGVRVILKRTGSTAVGGTGTISNVATAEITYDLAAPDTATVGDYRMECELTYQNGKVQTVPNDDTDNPVYTVKQDLGGAA